MIRSSSTPSSGGSGSKSILFSTTICGSSSRPAPYASSSCSIEDQRSAGSPSAASITWTSMRARSRCARNSWPSPAPSLAPSISPGTSATVSCRPSGESTVPSTGAIVVNGYSATFGLAFEMRRSSDDLPAFGWPTSAASARSFSRSSRSRCSPGSPTSANRGACRVGDANRRLPRPPAPPRASTTRAPGLARSATSWASSKICVPAGTRSSTGSPEAPFFPVPPPLEPRLASCNLRRCKLERSRRSAFATATTSPPGPPSPPSGPPFGTCFSRRKLSAPSPPRPALTRTRARSWNTKAPLAVPTSGRAGLSRASVGNDRSTRPSPPQTPSGFGRSDGYGAALAAGLELDLAVLRGEDRVVAADARTRPRAELRAALADEDHPRLHRLAVEDLHAEALGLRVAAVPGGTEPFLVCHLSLFLLLRGARRLPGGGLLLRGSGRLLRGRGALRADRGDLDLRERAPIAGMPPVAGALAVLADADLFALHVAEDLRRDLDLRLEVGLPVAAGEENVRVERLALVGLDPVHEQPLALA